MPETDEHVEAIRTERPHHPLCEGHVDCPECGSMCARPVVWAPGGRPHTVVCFGCSRTFAVHEDLDESTGERRTGGLEP